MNKFLSVLGLVLATFLTGCGGGGGGSAPQEIVVTAPGNGVATNPVTVLINSLLTNPRHMALYGNALYVADVTDTATGDGHIKVFNLSNNTVGSAIGPVISPVGIAFKSSGELFVTGTNPTSGRTGILQLSGNSVTEKVTGINPAGLLFDGSSYAYVADISANRVLVYDNGFAAASYSAPISNMPSGVAFDGTYIYATRFQGGNQGVYRFSVSGNSAVGGVFATSTYFNAPNAIAVRTATRKEIYVVNTGGAANMRSVLKISEDGQTVTPFLSASNSDHKLCGPTGIVIEGNYLYVANSTCSGSVNTAYAGALLQIQLP